MKVGVKMRLKAYKQDYNYEHHWNTKYSTPKQAMKYIKKLLRHFKLNADIYFTRRTRGWAGCSGYIELPKYDICLGLIAHEIGHMLAYKNGHKGHTKRDYKYIHRVYRYSIKYIPIETLLNINNKTLLLR